MIELYLNIGDHKIHNYSTLQKEVAKLPDGRYLCRIERKNNRTNQQNRYYWACVCELVKEGLRDMGWSEFETNEDAHELLKLMFLKKQMVNEQGEVIETIGSTKKLTTIEFNEYIEKIARWSAEYLNVAIPAPNTQSQFEYE